MQKFRKKPVEIEAEQFVVWNNKEVPAFIKLHDVTFPVYKNVNGESYVIIPTLEGQHIASNLDWVATRSSKSTVSYSQLISAALFAARSGSLLTISTLFPAALSAFATT